jgi:hypothetical protein
MEEEKKVLRAKHTELELKHVSELDCTAPNAPFHPALEEHA